jgi:hypothetical protein
LNLDISKLSYWLNEKEEEFFKKDIIDYEIKKYKASISSLRCRFDYLVEQLHNAKTTYEFISKI